eukprot:s1992_g16.t1
MQGECQNQSGSIVEWTFGYDCWKKDLNDPKLQLSQRQKPRRLRRAKQVEDGELRKLKRKVENQKSKSGDQVAMMVKSSGTMMSDSAGKAIGTTGTSSAESPVAYHLSTEEARTCEAGLYMTLQSQK